MMKLSSRFSDQRIASVKARLDSALPFVLMLLTLLLVFQFAFAVTPRMQVWINYASWGVAAYFAVRLVVDYKLHEPGERFWRSHWLDILMVIPLFTLLQEARVAKIAQESLFASQIGEEVAATTALRNTKVAAEVTKMARLIRRSV